MNETEAEVIQIKPENEVKQQIDSLFRKLELKTENTGVTDLQTKLEENRGKTDPELIKKYTSALEVASRELHQSENATIGAIVSEAAEYYRGGNIDLAIKNLVVDGEGADEQSALAVARELEKNGAQLDDAISSIQLLAELLTELLENQPAEQFSKAA